MTEFDPAMMERLAGNAWECLIKRAPHPLAAMLIATSEIEPDHTKLVFCEVMCAALRAIPISPAALNALWRGEAVVVPKEPSNEQISAALVPQFEATDGDPTSIAVYFAMLAASPYATETKDG